jgi:tetrahydromethanopterin S-methyltransferase subunit F
LSKKSGLMRKDNRIASGLESARKNEG